MNKADRLPAHIAEEKIRASEQWPTDWYDAQVTMLFTPPLFGWFDWFLHGIPRGGFAHIRCSEVDEPCTEMVRWITAIARGHFPAELQIDEEGRHVVLQADAVTDRPDFGLLKIVRDFESTSSPPELIYLSRINRRQLVQQFLRRWKDWLEHDYVAREWHEFGWSDDDDPEFRDRIPDPRRLDVSALETVGRGQT